MPLTTINGVKIFWEQRGESGPPLVLVHGSWADHRNWDGVVDGLARNCRVFTYDRRGHSLSERLDGQGHIEEDVADLAELIRNHRLAPAHVVGNSFGAAISLKLAAAEPDLFASLSVHEPPLLAMLGEHPARSAVRQRIGAVMETLRTGNRELGAQQFVDNVALGTGAWGKLPQAVRQTFVFNAPTFVDEINEPEEVMSVDLERLAKFRRPALVTKGDQSPPFFGLILDNIVGALPHAERHTFTGGGHVPHMTHPDEYVTVVSGFIVAAGVRVRSTVPQDAGGMSIGVSGGRDQSR